SHKYNDAEMPWSVQVRGSVMIHGSHSVPRRAASHGCIRVPLTGQNPARWIYDWIDLGTPIVIADRWPKPPASHHGDTETRRPRRTGDDRKSETNQGSVTAPAPPTLPTGLQQNVGGTTSRRP